MRSRVRIPAVTAHRPPRLRPPPIARTDRTACPERSRRAAIVISIPPRIHRGRDDNATASRGRNHDRTAIPSTRCTRCRPAEPSISVAFSGPIGCGSAVNRSVHSPANNRAHVQMERARATAPPCRHARARIARSDPLRWPSGHRGHPQSRRKRRRARAHRGVRLPFPRQLPAPAAPGAPQQNANRLPGRGERRCCSMTRAHRTRAPAAAPIRRQRRHRWMLSNSADLAGRDRFNTKRARARGQRPPGHIHGLEAVRLPFDQAAPNERAAVGDVDLGSPSDDAPAINGHTGNTGGTRVLPVREPRNAGGRWRRRVR